MKEFVTGSHIQFEVGCKSERGVPADTRQRYYFHHQSVWWKFQGIFRLSTSRSANQQSRCENWFDYAVSFIAVFDVDAPFKVTLQDDKFVVLAPWGDL